MIFMIKKLISFFQKDAVLTVSFFLAVLSCFFCPPGPQYLGYLDFHTLILLFCLMLIVAGLRNVAYLTGLAPVFSGM